MQIQVHGSMRPTRTPAQMMASHFSVVAIAAAIATQARSMSLGDFVMGIRVSHERLVARQRTKPPCWIASVGGERGSATHTRATLLLCSLNKDDTCLESHTPHPSKHLPRPSFHLPRKRRIGGELQNSPRVHSWRTSTGIFCVRGDSNSVGIGRLEKGDWRFVDSIHTDQISIL